jgi:hypothetical protein
MIRSTGDREGYNWWCYIHVGRKTMTIVICGIMPLCSARRLQVVALCACAVLGKHELRNGYQE